MSSLRDLGNRMLYWKTPLTARWQALNLTATAEEATAPLVLPLFTGYQLGWEDVTAQMQEVPVPLGVLTPAQAALLGPLINGSSAG